MTAAIVALAAAPWWAGAALLGCGCAGLLLLWREMW